MKKVQSFFKTITEEKYIPMWIFAGIQLIYHIFMRESETSDAMWFFSHQLEAFSLKDYLVNRYQTWSSRVVIESFLVYISQNVILWKVLDYLMWLFLGISIIGLFPEEKRRSACAMTVGVLLVYPIADLESAGWIATSLNYTWVLALGVFSLHGITRCIYGKKTPVWLGCLYTVSVIYSANMEQMCAILLAVNFLAVLYFIYKKISVREYWFVLSSILISAAELVFIMTAPGNAVREKQEVANWLPLYESYDIMDKLCIGFADTMQQMVASHNLIFLLFAGVLAVLVFLKSEELLHRFAAIAPIFLNIFFVFFSDTLEKYYPKFWKLFEENRICDEKSYHLGSSYVVTLIYLFVIACLLVSLIVICDNWIELIMQLYLLALGLASRVIMGFSPTIYISGERTFFFFYMIMGICATWMVVNNIALLRSKRKLLQTMQLIGLCVVLFSVIISLMETGSYHA